MERKIIACSLLVLLLISLMACAGPTAAVLEEDPQMLEEKLGDDGTVALAYGLSAKISPEVQASLMVTVPEEGTCLLSVTERESYVQGMADGGLSMGFLFAIHRFTQAQYEQLLCEDAGRVEIFARDKQAYYGWAAAADEQFYRSGEGTDAESEARQDWQMLLNMGEELREDFIRRNQLTAYDSGEFLRQEFTYDGEHRYVLYSPRPLSGEGSCTLVLSQPVRHGEGGIWCVERVRNNDTGRITYVFPSGYFDTEQSAAEYYTEQQARADASGVVPTWQETALQVLNSGRFGEEAIEEAFLSLWEGSPPMVSET